TVAGTTGTTGAQEIGAEQIRHRGSSEPQRRAAEQLPPSCHEFMFAERIVHWSRLMFGNEIDD
ncbi:MAG TPA: hypothetical protein VMX74_10575, partial [Pirellulales bacterium]|nr:hypothetical protein [Pirellulales bacterium]